MTHVRSAQALNEREKTRLARHLLFLRGRDREGGRRKLVEVKRDVQPQQMIGMHKNLKNKCYSLFEIMVVA